MSSEDSAFSKLPDHVRARVLAALDIKSRLRMARACKGFWGVCFESHRQAVWRCVEVAEAECRDLGKYEAVLLYASDMVKSLVIAKFSPQLLGRLPAMYSLEYLKLGGKFDLVDGYMLGRLASIFPVAVSICAQEARWHLSALESTRVAFPTLNELSVLTIEPNGFVFERPELNDLINTLNGIQTVYVRMLLVIAAEGPGIEGNPVDCLAATRWGKGVCDLSVYFSSSKTPPQTPIADFERLENLSVWDAKEQIVDWLRTLCAAPKLRKVDLGGCSGLGRLWGSESCFPVAVSEIELAVCSDMNDRFISQITRHLTSLNSLAVDSKEPGDCDIKFNVSAALQVLLHAESSLKVIRFGGCISPEHNSEDELRLVYNHFMENPGSMANLKKLGLYLSMLAAENAQIVELKLDGDCDLEELARRLPNPNTEIVFSEGRQILASAD